MVEWRHAPSRPDWQATQVRTPGMATRRFSGSARRIVALLSAYPPWGVSARARNTASFTVSSI